MLRTIAVDISTSSSRRINFVETCSFLFPLLCFNPASSHDLTSVSRRSRMKFVNRSGADPGDKQRRTWPRIRGARPFRARCRRHDDPEGNVSQVPTISCRRCNPLGDRSKTRHLTFRRAVGEVVCPIYPSIDSIDRLLLDRRFFMQIRILANAITTQSVYETTWYNHLRCGF